LTKPIKMVKSYYAGAEPAPTALIFIGIVNNIPA